MKEELSLQELLEVTRNAIKKANEDLGFAETLTESKKDGEGYSALEEFDEEKHLGFLQIRPKQWGVKGTFERQELDAILKSIIPESASGIERFKKSMENLSKILGMKIGETGIFIKDSGQESNLQQVFSSIQISNLLHSIIYQQSAQNAGKIFEGMVAAIVGGAGNNEDDSAIEDLYDDKGNYISLKVLNPKTSVKGSGLNLLKALCKQDNRGVTYLVCIKNTQSEPLSFRTFSFTINKENVFNFLSAKPSISIRDIEENISFVKDDFLKQSFGRKGTADDQPPLRNDSDDPFRYGESQGTKRIKNAIIDYAKFSKDPELVKRADNYKDLLAALRPRFVAALEKAKNALKTIAGDRPIADELDDFDAGTLTHYLESWKAKDQIKPSFKQLLGRMDYIKNNALDAALANYSKNPNAESIMALSRYANYFGFIDQKIEPGAQQEEINQFISNNGARIDEFAKRYNQMQESFMDLKRLLVSIDKYTGDYYSVQKTLVATGTPEESAAEEVLKIRQKTSDLIEQLKTLPQDLKQELEITSLERFTEEKKKWPREATGSIYTADFASAIRGVAETIRNFITDPASIAAYIDPKNKALSAFRDNKNKGTPISREDRDEALKLLNNNAATYRNLFRDKYDTLMPFLSLYDDLFTKATESEKKRRTEANISDTSNNHSKSAKELIDYIFSNDSIKQQILSKNPDEKTPTKKIMMTIDNIRDLAAAVGAELDINYPEVVISSGNLFKSAQQNTKLVREGIIPVAKAYHYLRQGLIRHYVYDEIRGLAQARNSADDLIVATQEIEQKGQASKVTDKSFEQPAVQAENKKGLTDSDLRDILKKIL